MGLDNKSPVAAVYHARGFAMRTDRRRFLTRLTFSSVLTIASAPTSSVFAQIAGEDPSTDTDRDDTRADGAQARPGGSQGFRGVRPGEERVIEGVDVCWCPPGRFLMGSPSTELDRRSDESQVEVTLTKGFWTAKHEVTQKQWIELIGSFPGQRPSAQFGEGDDVPVYWVTFDDAEMFCAAVTHKAHRSNALPTGWEFRLPTEAQWEYACRATTVTAFSVGGSLAKHQANFGEGPPERGAPAPGRARPVGSYPANAWGLQDMHGNVWEWCRDWYHAQLPGGTDADLYEPKGVTNRDGTTSRVRRGGAWIESAPFCRSACRLRFEPHRRSDHIGFRVVGVER
jgi:formylglycine-generating enzyme required for sulfatase activity